MTVMDETQRLAGTRCLLRPLRHDDAENVVRWRNQPQVADQMFSPAPTLDGHLRWFEQLDPATRQEFVILTTGSEQPVGTIGLSAIDQRQRRAEYGILIGERTAEGQGIAAEASSLLLDYAFGTLGLHRVFLQLFSDNIRALHLYDRLGFTHEGILRRHALRRGVYEDVLVMGLLAEEWSRSTE